MPNKTTKSGARDIQREGDDEAAVTGRTSSSTVETSSTAAMEAAAGGDAASSAGKAAGREMTAKRRRPLSEEDDGEDILPDKKNRVTFEGNEWEEETSSSTASTSDEEELIPQKGHPTQHQHGCSNSSSMPNYVTAYPHGHAAYRDFSTYIEDGGTFDTTSSSSTKRTFPANLHAMLSNDQYSHIISWMPHGRAFKVHDKKAFLLVQEAALGIANYPSFMRLLSEWGFKMMYLSGPDYGCYYHECFLRGHEQLTVLMRRVEEPDLYAMSTQYPLGDNNNKSKDNDNLSKEDTERVLFLANVALEYDQKESSSSSGGQCQQHDEMTAGTTTAFKEDPPLKQKNKPWSKKKKKSHATTNDTVAPPNLDDLPPQSEDDPLIITTRLNALMERTHLTQTQLETYDKQNGLPRSHAQTMLRSSRSRSQFQEVLKSQKLNKMGMGEKNTLGQCDVCWEKEDETEEV